MSPSFPFLTGMVPPLIKDKFGEKLILNPAIEEERTLYGKRATRFPPSVGIR